MSGKTANNKKRDSSVLDAASGSTNGVHLPSKRREGSTRGSAVSTRGSSPSAHSVRSRNLSGPGLVAPAKPSRLSREPSASRHSSAGGVYRASLPARTTRREPSVAASLLPDAGSVVRSISFVA